MHGLSFALALLRCLGWSLVLVPTQLVALALRSPLAERVPMVFHRRICRAFNFDVRVVGEVSRARPTLFVSNHCSYFDIVVLGGVLPGSFIAKREIRGWPLLGLYPRVQRTVFIDRSVGRAAAERDVLAARIEAGDNLILFPEATTGDGNRLLPFRSAFFALAERPLPGGSRRLTVQPVTVAYVRVNGLPLGLAGRARYAWYGAVPLPAHAWRALAGGHRTTVEVRLHEPVDAAAFPDRKALAEHCFRRVQEGLQAALHGRPAAPPPPPSPPAAHLDGTRAPSHNDGGE